MLIFGSSPFSKSSLYICKFSLHVPLKPSLGDFERYLARMGFPGGSGGKHLYQMQETQVQSWDLKDPLEKEMAAHSSTLAWKIPWTEDPGRPQSVGLHRVRHNWATSLSLCYNERWLQLCSSLNILWHCPSLGLLFLAKNCAKHWEYNTKPKQTLLQFSQTDIKWIYSYKVRLSSKRNIIPWEYIMFIYNIQEVRKSFPSFQSMNGSQLGKERMKGKPWNTDGENRVSKGPLTREGMAHCMWQECRE